MLEYTDSFDLMSKIKEQTAGTKIYSRREALLGGIAVLAAAATPKLAAAEVVEQKKEVEGRVKKVLNEENNETKKGQFKNLARPRLDLSASEEELESYSEQAGFQVQNIGVELKNKLSGERVRLLYGKNGEFAWLWTIAPGGMVPFMHNHVDEEEKIHLLKGTLSSYLEGHKEPVTISAQNGPTTFIIPKDTFHQPFNDSDEDVVGVVNFENPDQASVLSTVYWNMVNDGHTDKKYGRPNFVSLLGKTAALEDRTHIRGIPPFIQDLARNMGHFFGTSHEELLQEFNSSL